MVTGRSAHFTSNSTEADKGSQECTITANTQLQILSAYFSVFAIRY